jgi:hypothetical protein
MKSNAPVLRFFALVGLALLSFVVLRALREGVESFVSDHHPCHVDVVYYDDHSSDVPVFRHKMDRLALDYKDTSRLAHLNDRPFFACWSGRLCIREEGKYTFEVGSEEHVVLYLDDTSLVDNRKGLDARKKRVGRTTNLAAGMYRFRLEHEHSKGDAWIKVKWKHGNARPEVLRAPHVLGL